MCGSFGISDLVIYELELRYGVSVSEESRSQLRNLRYTPHTTIPTISRNSPNQLVPRYWSIIPPWINNPQEMKFPTFNARAETLRDKPTYRTAWKKGYRCVVMATQFYEWQKFYEGNRVVRRQPFTVKVKGEPLFSMAALYQPWNEIETVSIITTEPSYTIHNRMPVILTREAEEKWLDKNTDQDEAYALLQPFPLKQLEIEEGLPEELEKKPGVPEQQRLV